MGKDYTGPDRTARTALQVVQRRKGSMGTTVLDAIRVHGKKIGAVARFRGIGLNAAVELMVEDVEFEIDSAYRSGFAAGQRSMRPTWNVGQKIAA